MKSTTENTAVTETEAADLASFGVTEANTAVLEVRGIDGNVMLHPDGKPFTITLYSKDSAAFRDLARKQTDRRIQAQMRTRAPALSANVERDDIELLVAATKSWNIRLNGAVPPSSPEEYRKAYMKYPALKEQVDEFVGNRANFLKG